MAIDNLGRDSGNIPTEALLSGLKKQVHSVSSTGKNDDSGKLEKLLEATKKVGDFIGDNLDSSAKESAEYAKSVIDAYTNIHRKEAKSSKNTGERQAALSKDAVDMVSRIYKMGKSPKTFWVGLGHFHGTAISQMSKVLKDCGLCRSGSKAADAARDAAIRRDSSSFTNVSAMGKSGGGGNDAYVTTANPGDQGGDSSNNVNLQGFSKTAISLTAMAYLVSGSLRSLTSALNVDVMSAFDGALTNSNAFRESIREIVYQTRGFGNVNREIENQYNNIIDAQQASGMGMGAFQNIWVKNLKRGLVMENALSEAGLDQNKLMERRISQTKSVQTSGINIATQLNMNADSMNDLFMDWHRNLGMGSLEIQQMNRGMQGVARSTGVTGEALERAVKASDAIMKKMKDAGRLSAEASKSVLGMMTSAEKYGVGEKMGEMLNALSNPDGFLEASDQMKVLLIRSAEQSGDKDLSNRVYNGQATGPEDLTKIGKGFSDLIKSTLDGGFGINDESIKALGIKGGLDLTNLSEVIQGMEANGQGDQARHLQLVLKRAYGVGIGEIEQMAKSMKEAEEANKPFGDQMLRMTSELKAMEAAGMGATDAANELKVRMRETETNSLQDAMTQWQGALQRSEGDIDSAKLDLVGRLSQTHGKEMASKIANDIGGAGQTMLSQLSDRAKAQGKDFQSLLTNRGWDTAKIQKSITSGNAAEMKDALTVLGEVEQQIRKEEKEQQDPITGIRGDVSDINANITQMVTSLMFKIPDTLFEIIFWVAQIGGLLTTLVGTILSGYWLKGLASSLLTGGGRMANAGGRMANAGGRIANAGGRMANAGTSAARTSGEFLSKLKGNLLNGVGKSVNVQANPFATMSGGMGKAARVTQTARVSEVLIPKALGILSKALGPLTLAIGGLTGVMEAESVGRTKQEGLLLGALTGGAGTGSMFSGMLGIEKGTKEDKTLGVLGAGAWGAAAGAAIGAAFFGIGAVPGAIIGGIVGAAFELIKIITEGTKVLDDIISMMFSPIMFFVDVLWNSMKGLGKIIVGILTLDIEKVFKGLFDYLFAAPKAMMGLFEKILKGLVGIVNLVWMAIKGLFYALYNFIITIPSQLISVFKYISSEIWSAFGGMFTRLGAIFASMGTMLLAGLKAALYDIPKLLAGIVYDVLKAVFYDLPIWLGTMLYDTVKAVFYDLPIWLMSTIFEGLKSLASSEFMAPIIAPFLEIWNILTDIASTIASPFIEIWNALSKAWQDVKTAFDPLVKMFTDIKEAIFGVASEGTSAFSGLSILTGALTIVAQVIGFLIKVALFPLIAALKIAAFVVSSFVSFIAPMIKFITTAIQSIVIGVQAFVEKIIKGIELIKNFGSLIISFPSLILNSIVNGLATIGTWIYDSIVNGLATIGTWLYDSIVNGLATIGTWLYDTITGALAGLGEWIMSLIPGLGGTVKGATESSSEFVKTRKEEGDSLSHAAGGIIGATGDILTGNFSGGISKGWEATKEAGGAALSYLPFFEEGTRQIAQTGVAMLHEGEMVMPKNIWEAITAVGTGDFGSGSGIVNAFSNILNPMNIVEKIGSGSGIVDAFSNILNPMNIVEKIGSGIGGKLNVALDEKQKAMPSEGQTKNVGAFAPESATNALNTGVSQKAKETKDPGILNSLITALNPSKWFGSSQKESAGWFNDIAGDLKNALSIKSKSDEKAPVADAGKGLYYDMENPSMSGISPFTNSTGIIAEVASGLMRNSTGEASTGTGLDYKEEIKGHISPAISSLTAIEQKIASEKAGSEGVGTSTAMGLGGLESILNEEVSLLQMMYEALQAIKENTTGKQQTEIIGSNSTGRRSMNHVGVKAIARDYVRGHWNLTNGDYAPPSITSDGRGGE